MTITEGAPVSAVESSGLTSFIRIGGPSGVSVGDWVLVAASHNRNGGSSQTTLVLSGPNSEDAVSGGAINMAAGAHYAAAWLVYVDALENIPAFGETDPAKMWTVTAITTGTGIESNGDFAIAALPLTGAMPGDPIDSSTAAAQATTTTMVWDLANTTVDDTTIYLIGATERDLSIVPDGSLAELLEVKSANATIGRRTTLFIGKLPQTVAGDPGIQTATIGSTARQWRTFAFALTPAGLVPVVGETNVTVPAGSRVILDGSASPLATGFQWEQEPEVGVPNVILLNANTAIAEFIAENEGTTSIAYDMKLTINDGVNTAEATKVVTVTPPGATAVESLEILVCDGTGWV